MAQELEYYIHVGLPKTASTYLQVHVFPFLKGVGYFGKKSYKQYKESPPKGYSKLLYSSEKDIGLFEELEEIKRYRPRAKIIIVFREHFSWITSKYKYHIRKSGPLLFHEFYQQKLIRDRQIDDHFYRNIVAKIEETFPNRWLALRYDELKNDPASFNDKLLQFLGVDQEPYFKNTIVKPAFSNRQLYVIQKFNQTFRYSPSQHPQKWRRKLHYKLREFALHTVATLGYLSPAGDKKIEREIDSNRENIRSYFREDWDYIKRIS